MAGRTSKKKKSEQEHGNGEKRECTAFNYLFGLSEILWRSGFFPFSSGEAARVKGSMRVADYHKKICKYHIT